jgi:dipeptidyl aminopeptidase/acylaminoacyl peptidase
MNSQTRKTFGAWSVALALTLSIAGSVHAQLAAPSPTPPPVEAYGQVPAVEDVDISPAGTHLAWIDNSAKLARIVIFDLAAKREVRSLTLPVETTPRVVNWANDETLLANVTVTHSFDRTGRDKEEWLRWFAIDLAGGSPRILLNQQGSALEYSYGSSMVRRVTARPGKIFMSSWDYSATHGRMTTGSLAHRGRLDSDVTYNLYEVDLKSGDGKVLERGTPFTSGWSVDATGKIAVRREWDPTREKFVIHAKDGSGWRRLYESGRCGRLWGMPFNADHTAVLMVGSLCNEERVKLWSLPLDGSPMKALVEDPALDVEGFVTDPYDGTVFGATLAGDGNIHWLDERAEKRRNGLRRSFGTEQVHLYGRSADNQRVVVLAEGQSRAPVFHVVDYGAKRADIINEAYPKLVDAKLGTVRSFMYEARDRYPLMAYLTVPADAPEKNLPLVVLPHGGPESRDDPEFYWWAQFLASRGYAVAQPQFRGSSGFGKAHADAGRRQWGVRMQEDVTDAVRALVEQGIADPKRVCIVGASYGGYAALAGAAFTPDLYACAVSVAGVSDLPKMLAQVGNSSPKESVSLDYWKEHIGPPTDAMVIARSPARAARAVSAPILLIHGTDDTVVPIDQSRVMALELKNAGKTFEFVELPGEDHWLSQSETRIRMLTEIERFLAKHLAATGSSN